jgi:hypothetical protein
VKNLKTFKEFLKLALISISEKGKPIWDIWMEIGWVLERID